MPRWVAIPFLTVLVTFLTSSIYLRMKRIGASRKHSLLADGSTWRDVGGSRHARLLINRERLVTDLIVLPFALLLVLGLFLIHDLLAG
jgi:hypothetical protein